MNFLDVVRRVPKTVQSTGKRFPTPTIHLISAYFSIFLFMFDLKRSLLFDLLSLTKQNTKCEIQLLRSRSLLACFWTLETVQASLSALLAMTFFKMSRSQNNLLVSNN